MAVPSSSTAHRDEHAPHQPRRSTKTQDVASLFGLPKEMTQEIPAAGGRGSHSAALARQRLMGFNQQPPRQMSDQERKKLRDKRKQERKNKKKNRRR